MSELTLAGVGVRDTETLWALGALWRRAYNSNGPLVPLSSAEAFSAVLECAQTALWRVAGRHREALVSMAFGLQTREGDGAGAPIPGSVLIRLVAVDAPLRNRGFGRETVCGLLSLARESGFQEAQLWVGVSNVPARQAYERLGFCATGRSKLDERGEPISQLTVSLACSCKRD